ncbi:TolC family protein [Geofilum sp. OHC36d9]|uniref:TolC family protein n=1 Tax=Geofilum sp. OHC36d9 TaxID=3458413 RepID=UPI0040349914
MRLTFLIISLSILSITRGFAQSEELPLSLEDALNYAEKHAYMNRSSAYEIDAAHKKIRETIASGLPQVDFSGRYNHSMDLTKSLLPVEFFPEDNWPEGAKSGDKIAVAFGTAYDANYGINVTQLIFDGSYFVGLQAAKVYLDLAEQQSKKTNLEIKSSVAQAYFLVLSAHENQTAFEELLQINEELLYETKAMYNNGFVEALDVSQMELLVNDARKRLKEVERNEKVTQAVLKFTLGINNDIDISLTDSLSWLSQRIISEGMPAVEMDANNHPDYLLAMANEESQRLLLKNEQVQYLPKINAFYNYQKVGYSDEWNVFKEDWYKTQYIGLQMSLPIFSSGMRRAKVQQRKIDYLKSQTEKEMAVHQLNNSYLTAQADMKNNNDQYLYSIQNKNLALDILNKTRIKFSQGVVSSSEFAQQQSQYIQAQLNYVQSAVNLMNAHIALLKASGQL